MEIRHQAVKEFALWIASNPLPGRHRRGSENTLKGYIGDLGLFANWFKQSTGLDLGAETLTPDDIQDYISHAQTVEGKKTATILRYFAAIRAYALYLLQTDERITSDLTTGIRLPRQEQATKRGLRRLERLAIARVFAVPWKNTEKAKQRLIRNKAIIFVGMFIGLRLDEVASLKLKDTYIIKNSTSSYIQVLEGKGNRVRTVGVPQKARDALLEWLTLREELKQEDGIEHDYLFTQIKKGYMPLGIRAFQRIAVKVGERARIEDLTYHILRHTAVRVWRKKTDDRTTAAQMGHSVATMQKYDALRESDVLEAAGKF